jgi:methylenetetrahydrofolate dehydrogenase (NADP+)/methenyltetrahydrofolate cyclohydrolase
MSPDAICDEIEKLNADPAVAGIIVQMPLPPHIPLHTVIDSIDPGKDIDGIHPRNAGLLSLGYDGFLPATAQASVEILKRSGVEIAGKRVVVVGRSNVVGKPAALLLLREHGSVTVLHSKTRDLAHHTRDAEILIVAAGRPGLVTGAMLSPGVVVVDVGINVVSDGNGGEKLVGDVDFETAKDVVGAITPVPGGVGPLTNALLLSHLLRAATDQAERTARFRSVAARDD